MPDKERVLEICKIILWQLSKCIFFFYAGLYLMASIGNGAYRIEKFDPKSPFDFITWVDLDKCCTFSTPSKINLMSLVAAYSMLLLILLISVQKSVWLFVALVTLIHITVSCIVMQNFPLIYSYWLCLVVCSFVCVAVADIVLFVAKEPTHSSVDSKNRTIDDATS